MNGRYVWNEHWERLKRWSERIKDRNASVDWDEKKDRQEYEDFLLVFFQYCWHMRDWLAKDRSLDPRKKKKLNAVIPLKKGSMPLPLRVCQRLANRQKHMGKRARNQDDGWVDAWLTGRVFHTNRQGVRRGDYRIEYRDNKHSPRDRRINALVLARKAMTEWRKVLKQVGLPSR